MQTTLLGLAGALIIAILSALAAPLLVDWDAHRYQFEAQLSHALGAPATIAGRIDAAILPTPRFAFRNVTAVKGGVLVTVDEARGALSLGALLRGELAVEELTLAAPKVEVELDAAGLAPAAAPAADLAVEQLTIEDATLTIHQRRAGRTVTVTDIDANGQLSRLAGPFRLEGRVGARTERTAFRLASGGLTEAGLRLRLTLQAGRPSIDIDGSLRIEDDQPRFDGQIVVSRAAAGGDPLGRLIASGKLAATPEAVRFDTLALSAGPEERALELEGSARLNLGRQPRLDAVLGARQLDLDRAFGAASPAPPLTVLAALSGGADSAGVADLPVRIGLSADAVTLGGEVARDVRADLAGGRTAWTVEHFEARLPGRATLRVAGDGDAVAGFQGQLALEAADPGQLMRWLDRSDAAPAGRAGPLKAEAKVDLRPGRFVLDDLKLAGAGLELAGRLSWLHGGSRGALAADLTGATLDLDALQSLARTAGVTTATMFAGDVRLNLAIDALRYAGVTARRAEARLGWDAGALRIDHLKVADYGGLTAEAHGELAAGANDLAGAIKLSLALDDTKGLDAKGLDALAGLAALPPALAQRLGALTVPGRLTGEISAPDGSRTLKVDARGKTAAGPIELSGTVPLDDPAAATLHAGLTASGARLLGLLGLDGPAADGKLSLDWHGPVGPLDARLALPTLAAEAHGGLNLHDGRLDPDLAVTLAKADLAELMPVLGRGALPLAAHFKLVRQGEALRAAAIDGTLAGIAIGGALDIEPGAPTRLRGALDAARLDLPALAAALTGRSAPSKPEPAKLWPAEPFGKPALAALALDLALATPQLTVLDAVTVGDARLALVHAGPRSELALSAATLAGGTAQGRLILTRAEGGVGADLQVALANAELAALLPGAAPKPSGQLSLALEAAGTGRAPAELIKALAGSGTLTLAKLSWPGLSTAAARAAAGLAGQEPAPDEDAVRTAMAAALAEAPLDLAKIETTLAVLGGQLRAGPARTELADAVVRAAGALDLAALTVTGELALAPRAEPVADAPEIAVRWTGAAQAPERRLDVSQIVASLALTAADRAAKATDRAVIGAIPGPADLKVVPLPPLRPQEASPASAEAPDAGATSPAAPAAKPAAKPSSKRPAKRRAARAR